MGSIKAMLRKFAGVRSCADCSAKDCANCSNFLADGAAFDEIEMLYRHATVGLALMSRDMRWVRINEELAEINGHSVFDHIGAHLTDLLPEMVSQIMPVMTHVFDTGESVEQLEMSGYTSAQPDALRHWVTNFYPVKSAAGDVVGLLTIVIEQTAKIAARREVARAEAQLRFALETSGIGTWTWNMSTGAMSRSHMPAGALGYTEKQTADHQLMEEICHKDDMLRVNMEFRRYLKGKAPEIDQEYRMRSAAGRWVWFRLRGQALADEFSDGHFIVAGTYENIDTAKAEALERELLQNLSIRLSYLRSVEEMKEVASAKIGRRLEADFVSLVTFDEEQMHLRYETHWHTDRVQPISTTLEAKALPPEITAKIFKGETYRCDDTELGRPFGDYPATEIFRARNVRSLIKVPVVEEERFKALYVVQCAEPRAWLDREIEFVRKVLDLLLGHIARATAEANADNSRALIDHASRLGGIAIFDYDYERGARYVSEGFELITGCDANAGDKFDTYFNLVHPDDIRAFRAALLKSRDPSGDGLCIHDHRIVRDEHDVRWMQFRGQNLFSEDGVVQRWLGAVVEVTENRILENNLVEAERRYRLAGMASHDIIWDRDEVSGHCLWSIAISKVLGYKLLDDTTSLDWIFDHVHPEDKKAVESSFGKAMRSLAENWSMEYRVRKSDGRYAHVVDRCLFVRNADGIARRAVGVMHDLSEQRAANTKIRRQQQELERVSRLGTMGAMASTLAHELNQPLAAASNYLAVLKAMHAKTPEQDGQLDTADIASKAGEQVQRAGDIIRRMREFTLTGQISSEYTSLQQVLARSISDMRLLPDAARITLARSLTERVDMLNMDPLQIEQVIANVLKNAVEALRHTDNPRIEVTLTSSNGFADLTIADNGPGITDDAMRNMFHPFKSTKSTGLGLGLAICRTIVEAHGGRLTVEQRTEGGACFHITLPLDN